jgi:hypothetical protein
MGNPKSMGSKTSQRFAKKSNQRKQANAKKPMKKGSNEAGKNLFGQNTKKGSQKQLEHPLTLEVHLHGKHLCPLHPTKKNNNKNPKWDTQNLNVI